MIERNPPRAAAANLQALSRALKLPYTRAMAKKRGTRRPNRSTNSDRLIIYGTHAVEAVVANPKRVVHRLLATRNAAERLTTALIARGVEPEIVSSTQIERLVGSQTVHQGVAVDTEPLKPLDIDDLADMPLVVVLDRVTDPHNVGAILRSAAAFGAGALIMTERHAPQATATLAKSASGALEHVAVVPVKNLARALANLADHGFERIGLDSGESEPLEDYAVASPAALVLGAEGTGLRRLTRENCDQLLRLSTTGPIASLNVSNAAAVALHTIVTSKSWNPAAA